MNLTTATPVEIDTKLAEIDGRLYLARLRERWAMDTLRQMEKESPGYPDLATRREARTIDLANTRDAIDLLEAEQEPYHAEFSRRGGWTRAFLVVTNGKGHVHRDTRCHTCYTTTQFAWLPTMSGQPEAEIVAAAGERACTVCYPTAPAEVLRRPTQLFTDDERTAQVARDERKAKAEAKAAKAAAAAIAMPDGSPLRDTFRWIVKTERTAQTEYINAMVYLLAVGRINYPAGRVEECQQYVTNALAALAAKRGVTPTDVALSLDAKVEARYRRDYVTN